MYKINLQLLTLPPMSDHLSVNEYTYHLPEDRIAAHPLPDRDQSKLLVYRKGKIVHTHFKDITGFLPNNTALYFNDTRVIPARLHFTRDTGSQIELFLLNPVQPSRFLADAMKAAGTCTWQCMIGNLKRWKPGMILMKNHGEFSITVRLLDREAGLVEFSWQPENQSFAEILNSTGITPLPPYIKREAGLSDRERYQTVYSAKAGAVAAPTAGLHFTERVLQQLAAKGIETNFLTLHVSAGTFQPIKTENALAHTMHEEQMVITRKNLEHLMQPGKFTVAVGTTSMRTLESLYWFGVKLQQDSNATFDIKQHDPYQTYTRIPDKTQALHLVKDYMDRNELNELTGHTSIYIHPGYAFRVCEALVTNFHLPGSTLMLLVAAFIGHDWKTVYDAALQHQYRFLSYGDSSILIP
jgi:S-adenosylmethionine:tRNA ribosyltransferase-isomerase